MRKIIILLFALLLMASCIAGRYDETKEAEYLDYVTDKIADKIVKREATEEARDSYIYYGEERYIDENGLAHRGNSVSTWTVDNYNTKELKRTGNYLYVPYPDEDPYKDSPEYQVEYQNYLDEHDGID